MTTKDIWKTLSFEQKTAEMKDALNQLLTIEHGQHPMSNKMAQGCLSKVKKDLEQFIINTADWEATPGHRFATTR
jgi:hypothetical protein